MRKHTKRRIITPQPPRGLRPKLTADQVRDLSLAHHVNLDSIASGTATADILWQWAAGCLTWSHVAELMNIGHEEMAKQLHVASSVIDRFKETGRIEFTPDEYQLARDGVGHMDDLAAMVDRSTAIRAAEWSEERCAALQP